VVTRRRGGSRRKGKEREGNEGSEEEGQSRTQASDGTPWEEVWSREVCITLILKIRGISQSRIRDISACRYGNRSQVRAHIPSSYPLGGLRQ